MTSYGPEFERQIDLQVEALSLAEKLRVYFLECETPRVAVDVLHALEARLSKVFGREVPLVHITSDFSGSRRDERARQLMIEYVLGELLPTEADQTGESVVRVLDLARARRSEEDDWRIVFQRINETRNVLTRSLRGGLLVLYPPWFHAVAARAAPDLVSIASEWFRFVSPANPSGEIAPVGSVPPAALPDDPVALRHATLDLLHAGRKKLAQARFDLADERARESVRFALEWVKRLPTDRDAYATLADALWLESEAAEARGDLPRARERAMAAMAQVRAQVTPETRAAKASRALRLTRLHAASGALEEAMETVERVWADAVVSTDDALCLEVGLERLRLYAQGADRSRMYRAHAELVPIAQRLGSVAQTQLDQQMTELIARTSAPPITPAPPAPTLFPPPGGPYRRDAYVPRPRLEALAEEILRYPGSPLVLLGPRGMGKTWLIRRLLDTKLQGRRLAELELGLLIDASRASMSQFITAMMQQIVDVLNVAPTAFERWVKDERRTPTMRATGLLRQVLETNPSELVLVLVVPPDMVHSEAWSSTEAMLRTWNERAGESPWDRLRLVVELSTISALWTRSYHGSPFTLSPVSVGELEASEFNDLIAHYGCRLTSTERSEIEARVGRHPLLVSVVLHALSVHGMNLHDALRTEAGTPLRGALDALARGVDQGLLALLRAVANAPGGIVDASRREDIERLRVAGFVVASPRGFEVSVPVFKEMAS